MDLSQRKEQFSRAYVRAVAATAGYSLSIPEVDDDSVDFTLYARGSEGHIRSPQLDIQVKCTGEARNGDPLRFRLKRKNYVELQGDDLQNARILVVVFVPEETEHWLQHSEHQLALCHCGYWLSLRKALSLADGVVSKTVDIPRSQQFTVEQLTQIVRHLSYGEKP